MYKWLIRPLLFLIDPEVVHHLSFSALKFLFALPGGKGLARLLFAQDTLRPLQLWGLTFKNPIGLAAGFDKDGLIAENWQHLGFGFVELGTVTPRPQAGNPKKRLFRLPADQAIINRMGFNNQGVDALVKKLVRMEKGDLIVGANIGKNKDTPNERAVDDYVICFDKLAPYVDYFVVNVSSPNTPGLRSLQEKAPLTNLLNTLQERNQALPTPRPLLLKIAPDLNHDQLDDIVEVVQATRLDGLIANNTTISRAGLQTPDQEVKAMGNGGLSGAPLRDRSQEVMQYLRAALGPDFPIVGVGGIMTAADAEARLAAGANLLQVYTGFVYEGPAVVQKLLTGR
ncbi:MAG: quinone-dependent dihydroorotate dehydrogenase [Bacteroidota bacterium]